MQAFSQLCQQVPDDAEAWMMLGVTQAQLGALPQAITHLQHATQVAPTFGPAWANLGLALMNANQVNKAEACLRQAIELDAKDAGSVNNLGTLYRQTGKTAAAIEAFKASIRLQPRNPLAHNNLGSVLQEQCLADEAIESYKRALKLDPQFAQAEFNLGSALQGEGQHEQALYHYNKALKLNPSLVDATAAAATLKEKEGNFAEAKQILAPHLHSQNTAASVALAYAAVARRINESEDAAALLRTITQRNDLPPIDRQAAEFALGDIFDQKGEYESAFAHYQQANNIRAYDYDRAACEQEFRSLMSMFSAADSMPKPTHTTPQPVVMIVGMPRSSTSLVEQILCSHPEVHGGGELAYVGKLTAELGKKKHAPFPEFMSTMNEQDIAAFGKNYLKQVRALNPRARFITDKMPHNFLYLGLLAKALPNLKIIHCKRNPLDTCLSIYFQNFNTNHPYTTNLADLGHYYRQYEALMAHWHEILGSQIMDLSYEELISDQETLSRQLLDFCDLEWDDSCLEFHRSKRRVNTPSYDQVRRPIYQTSKERWRNYERHITPLINALGKMTD